jgi:peroxiredoxin
MRYIVRISVVLLFTLLLAGCGNAGETPQSAPAGPAQIGIMTGQRAPDFMLSDLSGTPFTLSQLRGSKAVMLVFWATWCPACIQTIPQFSELHTQYGSRGFEVVSVNIASNDPLPRVQRFQEINRLPYRILYDEKTDVSRTYGVFGIPTTLIIDRDGIIRYRGNLLPPNPKQFIDRLVATAP